MRTFINYVKETKEEMTHVSWPTRHQTIVYTSLVIFISLFVAAFLGVFDVLFTKIIGMFVSF
jgi:preprotein translocase SecE subunit